MKESLVPMSIEPVIDKVGPTGLPAHKIFTSNAGEVGRIRGLPQTGRSEKDIDFVQNMCIYRFEQICFIDRSDELFTRAWLFQEQPRL